MQRGLDAAPHHREGGIRDVEMRIDAESDRKEGGIA